MNDIYSYLGLYENYINAISRRFKKGDIVEVIRCRLCPLDGLTIGKRYEVIEDEKDGCISAFDDENDKRTVLYVRLKLVTPVEKRNVYTVKKNPFTRNFEIWRNGNEKFAIFCRKSPDAEKRAREFAEQLNRDYEQ